MKKIAQVFLIAALTSGVAIADTDTIPWTFDDFDENGDVVDHAPLIKIDEVVQ